MDVNRLTEPLALSSSPLVKDIEGQEQSEIATRMLFADARS
jgi:hypothetical protein